MSDRSYFAVNQPACGCGLSGPAHTNLAAARCSEGTAVIIDWRGPSGSKGDTEDNMLPQAAVNNGAVGRFSSTSRMQYCAVHCYGRSCG